jgi:hypothetical protein
MIKTVTLETAKALKEAGYPQNTQFVYSGFKQNYPISIGYKGNGYIAVTQVDENRNDIGLNVLPDSEYEVIIAAPTAEEILEQLPFFIKTKENQIYYLSIKITMKGDRKQYLVEYLGYVWGIKQDNGLELLAEAAAKMWLYLKKEGLL